MERSSISRLAAVAVAFAVGSPRCIRSATTGHVYRIWRSSAGTEVEARLLHDRGGLIVLETTEGSRVQITPGSLSLDDQRHIAKTRKNNAGSEPDKTQTGAGEQTAEPEKEPAAAEFKGLRLRMTRDEVAELEDKSPWSFDQMGRSKPTSDKVYLGPDFGAQRAFTRVGKGRGGSDPRWIMAYVLYYRDEVYKIAVIGPSHKTDESAALVDKWLIPSADYLYGRFGKPVSPSKRHTAERAKAQTHSGMYRLSHWEYARWQVGEDQTLDISVVRDRAENTCAGYINFVDHALEEERRKSRRR